MKTLSAIRHHFLPLSQLAYPILIGQIAQTGMGTVDTIMAGRFSAVDLAAVAIGQSLWLPLVILFIGLFTATATMIARFSGADDSLQIQLTLQQSCWLALLCCPLGIFLLLQTPHIAQYMGLEAAALPILSQYIQFLCYGIPAGIFFFVLRSYIEGMGYTKPIMVVSVLCFIINIPLNYLFIFGKLGLPALGGAGCGLATSISQLLLLLGALYVIFTHSHIKAIKVFTNWPAPSLLKLVKLLGLGLPIAFTMVAEVGMFAVIALLIAPLGTLIVASHQIAISVSAITFMLPLSMGIAMMIRIGHLTGANHLVAAKYCTYAGLIITLLISLINLLVIYYGRDLIASIYTHNGDVIKVTVGILVFTAMYQIADGLQIAATHALRGYHDTRVSMAIALIAYWCISVPLGYALCMGYTPFGKVGVNGMWIGLVIGLTIAAILQSWRLKTILQRQPIIASHP